MKKILCPVDFTDVSNNTITYAARFAKATDSELVLFNVQPLRVDAGSMEYEASFEYTWACKQLESVSREVSRTFAISCYAEVITSYKKISTVIGERATAFDLVIVGSSQPHNLYHLLTGSNTFRILHESRIPFLIVPEKCMYQEIQNTVYGYDYLRERKLPLVQLTPWLKVLNTKLLVLQVMEEAWSGVAEEHLYEMQEVIRIYTQEALRIEFKTVHSATIAESIHDTMRTNGADLLALCSHDHGEVYSFFHHNIIKEISRMANYPIFIFHY